MRDCPGKSATHTGASGGCGTVGPWPGETLVRTGLLELWSASSPVVLAFSPVSPRFDSFPPAPASLVRLAVTSSKL